MEEIGHFGLCLAWLMSLFGICGGVFAGVRKNSIWLRSVVNSTVLLCLCVGVAIFSLGYSFYHDDYTNQYVWQFSNKDMDWIYKITAIWGGMDGSMLLWAFMLSVSGCIVALRTSNYPRLLMPWVLAVVNSSIFFFLNVVDFFTNPFR